MKILSIETSCDDTGISIIEAKGSIANASFKVLANSSNSQIKIHIPYGGVYPALAKREHTKNLPILLQASLRQAKLDKKEKPVDVIAVTYGPGLEMCLWEGIIFAQELAKKWKLPIIPVNHMEGHILSVFGKNKASPVDLRPRGKFTIPKLKTPILSLLVSGGHTQLVLIKKWMQYEIIGESLDDAVGEAFDKVARMLDLPYPGGPQISKLAEAERVKEKQSLRGVSQADGPRGSAPRARGDSDLEKISFSVTLPRPMLHSKNFNFSFSGLKTAVLYLIKKIGPLTEETKSEIALEFENAAIECLVYKTEKAIEKYNIKTLIVAGGVACNTHLQREMSVMCDKKIKILFPTKELAGDNSLMIGIAGYLNYIKNKKKVPKLDSIKATGNLRL
jgi:N6-L-threonylcarbamoyladenine synthase